VNFLKSCLLLMFPLLVAQPAEALTNQCLVGVPNGYNYQTVIHRTGWDELDYFNLQSYFSDRHLPNATPWVRISEVYTVNGVGIPQEPAKQFTMTNYGPLPQMLDWFLHDPQWGRVVLVGDLSSGTVHDFMEGSGPTYYLYWEAGRCLINTVLDNTPVITLSVPSLVTLSDAYQFKTTFTPVGVVASNYKYEIRFDKKGKQTWYTLYNGPNPTFDGVSKVAGKFFVRVTITVNGSEYVSAEQSYSAQFPSSNDIKLDSDVQAATLSAWISTLLATTPASAREEGFYIYLNTSNNSMEFSSTSYGRVAYIDPTTGTWARVKGKTLGPTVTVTGPGDSIDSPTPLDSPTYRIAFFHTHVPPIMSSLWERPTGPSEVDEDSAVSGKPVLALLVYDYLAPTVIGGSSWFAPAGLWPSLRAFRRPIP
jgi:hypothetical protein